MQNFPKSSFYDDGTIRGLLNKWTNCFPRADINYWKIFNQGHEWDGPNDFDTSQTIWNFIRNFDLNGAKNLKEKVSLGVCTTSSLADIYSIFWVLAVTNY